MPNQTPFSRLACLALLLALAACAPQPAAESSARTATPPANGSDPEREPDEDDDVTTAQAGVAFETVPEAFVSALEPEENIDSPASWQGGDGSTWVVASGKSTHRLTLYDGDSGAVLRRVAEAGDLPGQLRRPNGVFVIDDRLFVVERDNRRVQVFALPSFAPLGSFGQAELRKPYGVWVMGVEAGYEVIVSDAYMSEADADRPPPPAALGERFKRYRVVARGPEFEATLLGSFGATDAAGAIRIPESLWGDPAQGRLMLAEEDQKDPTRYKVYDLSGRYAGSDLGAGRFHAQAEGIALWQCRDGSGYWIATDPFKDRSVFHVFDRVSLEHRGAFAGEVTANTDGVWLQQSPTRAFPAGVFYAVHDDQALAAFDWRAIARALALPERCGNG